MVGHYSDVEALKVLTFDSCGCNCGSYNCGVFKSFDIVTRVKLGCFLKLDENYSSCQVSIFFYINA